MPNRIAWQLPLSELWNESGLLPLKRQRDLSRADDVELLRQGLISFVVADSGHPLTWVQVQDCYRFWKDEVKPRLGERGQKAYLEEFPGEYCYFASEWGQVEGVPVIVLEKAH